uniref:Glutaredoxin n=1 Tax=Dromaius novaehollandiae TaxID=8790 RepID=A0A8C4JFQ6_DRONO|nr:glutaredoxin-1 [Dromaius novaehollandiae]
MADRFVSSRIGAGKVTVFMKPSCPYYRNAMAILRKFNFRQGCLDLVDITGMDEVQDYLQEVTRQRTVPWVFIGEDFFGGCSRLQDLHGQLPGMLCKIGALQ